MKWPWRLFSLLFSLRASPRMCTTSSKVISPMWCGVLISLRLCFELLLCVFGSCYWLSASFVDMSWTNGSACWPWGFESFDLQSNKKAYRRFSMFQHLDYVVVVYLLSLWRARREIKSKAASSYCTYREDNQTALNISLTKHVPHNDKDRDKTKYHITKRKFF